MTLDERNVWQTVFKNPHGEAVITVMLNRLGYFSADRSLVNPDLIAFANWMLAQIGITTVPNLQNYVTAIMQSASNKDLEPTGETDERIV